MFTCELCGKRAKQGYLVIDLKLSKTCVVCYKYGKPIKLDKKK